MSALRVVDILEAMIGVWEAQKNSSFWNRNEMK